MIETFDKKTTIISSEIWQTSGEAKPVPKGVWALHLEDEQKADTQKEMSVKHFGGQAFDEKDEAKLPPQTEFAEQTVLDEFLGRIEDVHDGWAFIILEGQDGAHFTGKRRIEDFEALGITTGDYFTCKTIKSRGIVQVQLSRPQNHEFDPALLDDLKSEILRIGEGGL